MILSWPRIAAAVLTSKLFFLASCTGGSVAGVMVADSLMPTSYMERGGVPDPRMAIVAVLPDTSKPGTQYTTIVLLSGLEDFRKRTPEYSFIPAAPKGEIDRPDAGSHTTYTVQPAAPGRVIVETNFFHDAPPMGLNVRGRYEATEKSVKPLSTTTSSNGLVGFVFGVSLALMLAIVGGALKRRLARARPPT